MLGTLAGALEVRGIMLGDDALEAWAEGTNEVVDRIVLLRSIHIRYHLDLPDDAPMDRVERALETHAAKCPTARSLEGAVQVTWSVDYVD